ncbi:hypothetical protein [Nocardia sp. NPDC005825]|uniref:hypothetical protein n=1 Tax=unclassified Nocardia TaxID=2637762 RepID=UPI003406BA9E
MDQVRLAREFHQYETLEQWAESAVGAQHVSHVGSNEIRCDAGVHEGDLRDHGRAVARIAQYVRALPRIMCAICRYGCALLADTETVALAQRC